MEYYYIYAFQRCRINYSLIQSFKIYSLIQRAEDETRTRDIQLGRLMLYQLSYFRLLLVNEFIKFIEFIK